MQEISINKTLNVLIEQLREKESYAREAGDLGFANGMACARIEMEVSFKSIGYNKPITVQSEKESHHVC